MVIEDGSGTDTAYYGGNDPLTTIANTYCRERPGKPTYTLFMEWKCI